MIVYKAVICANVNETSKIYKPRGFLLTCETTKESKNYIVYTHPLCLNSCYGTLVLVMLYSGTAMAATSRVPTYQTENLLEHLPLFSSNSASNEAMNYNQELG